MCQVDGGCTDQIRVLGGFFWTPLNQKETSYYEKYETKSDCCF